MITVQPRRSLGIQARLVVLVLVTVLPLVALSSFAILRTVDNERSRIERGALANLPNLSFLDFVSATGGTVQVLSYTCTGDGCSAIPLPAALPCSAVA
jgi:hypothetical protein